MVEGELVLPSIILRTFTNLLSSLSVLSGLGMFGRAKKVGLEFNVHLLRQMMKMMMMMLMEAKVVIRK